MPDATPFTWFLKDTFPKASPELLRLFEGAAENAGLFRSDCFTIRDWLEIADHDGHEGLAALLLVLMLALEEGSLCVEADEAALARRLADVVDENEALSWARRILDELAAGDFARLIGAKADDQRPVIRHAIGERHFFYFQKYLRAELDFHERFRRRLETAVPPALPENLPAVVREVLVEQPLRVAERPLRLDPGQQLAVGAALCRNLAIISGGPGTGKTSIVLTLLRCLVRAGYAPERIALAAPTGRAAQRLTDALRLGLDQLPADSPDAKLRDLAATTLHQLLGYRPTRNVFSRHVENPVPADVVVVDEASMVGLVLMAQLLQALEPHTKLILLGDKDQLPSVDAGAVLASLVPDGRATAFGSELASQLAALFPDLPIPAAEADGPLNDAVVVLQTNHRSQAQIRAAAEAINRQDTAIIDRLPALTFPAEADAHSWWLDLEADGGCRLLEQVHATPGELRGFLDHWTQHWYFGSSLAGETLADLVTATESDDDADRLRRMFHLLERYRLLALVREGPWGAVEINRFLDQLLRPRLDPDSRLDLFAGSPVLITRNDPLRQLFNGDVGLALRVSGGLRVVFPRQGSFVSFAAESLPAHEPGFALTVHKSQGSEYGHVMAVLPPEGGRRLLTKELVYTAITRAKSLAVLCGTKDVLRLAIGRKVVRESGMLRLLESRL